MFHYQRGSFQFQSTLGCQNDTGTNWNFMQRINCFVFYLLFDDNNEGLMTGVVRGMLFISSLSFNHGSDEGCENEKYNLFQV